MRHLAIVAFALALPTMAVAATGSSGSTGSQGVSPGGAKAPASAIIPHTTMTMASIDSGKSRVAGLSDMAAKPDGWDAAHANMYLSQIKQDLQMANEHLSHLVPAAQGKPDASRDLQQAQSALGRAAQVVSSFTPQTTPELVTSRSKDLWNDLDQAGSKVGDLAKELGAPSKLGTP
jgi:hypothetical protein